jgi:hypothetical protein
MRQLGVNGQKKELTLDTMGAPYTYETYLCKGLEVSSLHSDDFILLPSVYTKDKMPVSANHILVQDDIMKWDHLNDVVLPHIDTTVGILIGNNVPDAYTLLDLRTGPQYSPHATQTRLGWIVWNVIRDAKVGHVEIPTVNSADVIAVREVEELHQLDKLVRESINLDFPERQNDDVKQHSQEDKMFLAKVDSSLELVNGHYQLGLPFRNTDNVVMPNNQKQALNRLKGTERKMVKNKDFHRDYSAFMKNILDKC